MEISYLTIKEFDPEDLGKLFNSVGWESGRYPEKLRTALRNSGAVFSAWAGNRLAGLVNAMDDGVINAYIQYLLVDPEFQGRGIGKKLIEKILKHYEGYMRTTLIAYDHAAGFYQKCGFSVGEGKIPLSVSSF